MHKERDVQRETEKDRQTDRQREIIITNSHLKSHLNDGLLQFGAKFPKHMSSEIVAERNNEFNKDLLD